MFMMHAELDLRILFYIYIYKYTETSVESFCINWKTDTYILLEGWASSLRGDFFPSSTKNVVDEDDRP